MENIEIETKAKTPRRLTSLWQKIRYSQIVFLIVYCLAGMHTMSIWGYLPSILTTLEKRFGFNTQAVSAVFVIAEISTFTSSIILSYYGGNKHQPRMMAIGLMVWGTAMVLVVSPQFIYGSNEISGSSYDKGFNSSSLSNSFELSCERVKNESCDNDSSTINTSSVISLCLISLGIFISNAGITMCTTIGPSFVDNNVDKKNTGLYFGLYGLARQIGFSCGIFYASKFLSLYQTPSVDPGFDEEDLRWVGAWWIGFIVMGIQCFIIGILMGMFPQSLKSLGSNKSDLAEAKRINDANLWKDLPSIIKNLFQNKVYIANMFCASFGWIGTYGSNLTIPKVFEVMFYITPSEAGTYTGYINIISSVVGLLGAGIVIKVFKPSSRKIAVFLTVSGVLNAVLYFSVNGITCGNPEIKKEIMASEPQCMHSCNCDNFQFDPICDLDSGITYFSPCHANCKEHHIESGNVIYRQCGCNVTRFEDGNFKILSMEFDNAQKGVCKPESFIPTPIFIGMVVDQSCNTWHQSSCEESNTFCVNYDYGKFRDSVHMFIGAAYLVGAGFAAYMTLNIKQIKDFYSDDDAYVILHIIFKTTMSNHIISCSRIRLQLRNTISLDKNKAFELFSTLNRFNEATVAGNELHVYAYSGLEPLRIDISDLKCPKFIDDFAECTIDAVVGASDDEEQFEAAHDDQSMTLTKATP
ncbi:Solute carrier organic anion transporter family member 1C1 [Nymphon striatum]|nr:Solute carrier organic anion transporter family member 1C1 [Nymphon striatum]